MAYVKYVYNRVNWVNKSEALTTPLGATNLNRMDYAIYMLANNIDVVYSDMGAGKLDKTDANKMLRQAPTWDPNTGILTFRFYDGTEFSIDFNIEKIPVSFSMNSAGVITMTTADGTQWTADIGSLIPDYTFKDSDRITFTKTKNSDGSYAATADLIKGSITDEYLQPNYLADITTQANKAEASAQSAADSADDAAYDAKLAQSYSVGGSGIRSGEDTDNAKYYAQQSSTNNQSALQAAQSAAQSAQDAADSASNAKDSENNASASEAAAANSAAAAQTSETNAASSEAAAADSAQEASDSADLSKSWAVGDTGIRNGEDTNNSKYYAEQSKQYHDKTEEVAEDIKDAMDDINKKLDFSDFEVDDDGNLIYTDDGAYDFVVEADGELYWGVAS